MNPILNRELRARWRDNRSFLLIFAISLVLSAATLWTYWNRLQLQWEAAHSQSIFRGMVFIRGTVMPISAVRDLSNSLADMGRTLFQTMMLFQVTLWLLVAPVIAAPVIAGERERGLLEGLWLTRLNPFALLAGRLLSCLSLIAVLQIATLPFAAISLTFGGVSPGEILIGMGYQMLAALTGTSLGLCTSARHTRPPGALTAVVTILIAWSCIVLAAKAALKPGYLWGSNLLEDIDQNLYLLICASHPVAAADAWLNGWSMKYTTAPDEVMVWGTVGIQALICVICLGLARRAMVRPLAETGWLGRNPVIERYRRRLHEATAARVARHESQAGLKERAGQTLLLELPVHLFVRFRNPVLQREVAARFRLRRVPLFWGLVRIAIVLVIIVAWILVLTSVTDAPARHNSANMLLAILCVGGVIAAGLLGSTGFSREKESGTWEGLRLALLSAGEIVRAKWRAPLVTILYFGAPFWVLLPLSSSWFKNGTAPLEVALKTLVVVSTISAATAGALWFSWRCRNSTTATAWVLSSLLVLHIGAPQINDAWGLSQQAARAIVPRPFDNYGKETLYYGAVTSDSQAWRRYDANLQLVRGIIEAPLVMNSLAAWPNDQRWQARPKPEADAVAQNLATVIFYLLLSAGFCWSLCRMVEREVREGRPLPNLRLRRRLAASAIAS